MSSNEIIDNSQGSSRGRAHWSSRLGFVLAAAGSAIGLGNIWKFPYITGEFGGGAFVLVYLGCVLLVGLPLMIAELMIGRKAQKNPVGAFQVLHKHGSLWQTAGWLGVASGFLILSFYSVIAGWAIAYVFKSLAGFTGTAEQIKRPAYDERIGEEEARGVEAGNRVLQSVSEVGIVSGEISELTNR